MNSVGKCECETRDVSESELFKQLDAFINEYRFKSGALIPILQIAQNIFGYLSDKVLKHISVQLNISFSEVAGVVSFYSYFSRKQRGKYLIKVCLGTACYVRGGQEILKSVKNYLGIDVGETTSDHLFSLDIGRCFGACGLAPVIMVNDDVHQKMKPVKVGEILDLYKTKPSNGKDS